MQTAPSPQRRFPALAATIATAVLCLASVSSAQAAPPREPGTAQGAPSSSSASPAAPTHEEKSSGKSRENQYAAFTTDPASPLVLVNEHHPLQPADYVPQDLVPIGGSGTQMVPEAAAALGRLVAGAADDGHDLVVESAYRSYDYQVALFRRYTRMYGDAYASRISARPGTSEHQLGLAADVGLASGQCSLKACLGNLPAGRWMARHAAEYGFIVRYPRGEQDTTGYAYEPWHLRYVTVRAARQMRDQGVSTLEQYSDELASIRDARGAEARRKAAELERRAAAERDRLAHIADETRWMPDWARAAYTR